MDLLEALSERAAKDDGLLERNKRYGDNLATPRLLMFELLTDSQNRAEEAFRLLDSCGYGEALVGDDPEWSLVGDDTAGWRVIFRAVMPSTPATLKCTSAFMVVLAHHFGLSYEGWAGQLMTS